MAVLITCWQCGKKFTTSASNYGARCADCDGTNEAKRQEENRWKALSLEQKVDELRQLMLRTQQQQLWDGRFG